MVFGYETKVRQMRSGGWGPQDRISVFIRRDKLAHKEKVIWETIRR
jgi:hypothetical protein